MNGGAFLGLREDKAYEFLEKLSKSSQQWDFTSNRDKPVNSSPKSGLYEITEVSKIEGS